MNLDIQAFQNRIENLFSKHSSITDMEVQSNWAKYLCVLVSGYIEESLRILFYEYAKNHSNPQIRRYIDLHIRRITNCKNSRILEVLNHFSDDWVRNYNDKIASRETSTNQIKDSIDSIIDNRHQIAHGRNVGISFVTVKSYYDSVKVAIDVLHEVIY